MHDIISAEQTARIHCLGPKATDLKVCWNEPLQGAFSDRRTAMQNVWEVNPTPNGFGSRNDYTPNAPRAKCKSDQNDSRCGGN